MKTIKHIFLASITAIMFTSCIVDDEADDQFLNSPAVVGFSSSLAAESYFVDEGAILRNYQVDLLGNGGEGEAPTSPITVSYEIDTEATTAVEGQEFNFVDNSGTVTIPAGSTFANFPLEINTGNLDPDMPTKLVLNLISTDSDNAVVSSNNDVLEITFVGCQSQLDQFTYTVNTTRISNGNLVASSVETFTSPSVNEFSTVSTGPYGPNSTGYAGGSIAANNGFTFIDICGEITISNQGLANNAYSNEVYGSGTVDPDTGTITLTYTITFGSGNQTFESVFVQQ